jgi:sulfofructose kinase
VLCAGLSCVDHIWRVESFPPSASRTDASDYRLQGGGPAATAAVTVARLGGKAYLWALHGDDQAGRVTMGELERFGVDTSGVQVLPGATSWVSGVLVAPGGERFIFPYRGSGLLDRPPSVQVRPRQADVVLVDFRHPGLCEAALDWAAELDATTVGDLGNAAYWRLSERLDVIIASEECAAQVLGRDDPEAALAAMRWREGQHIGITLGPEGYLYDAGQGTRHLPALPVETIDTTGAGDVFHGAYAYALASGSDGDRCAMYATVTAALACTGIGRSAIPTGATVERLLESRSLGEMRGRR